MYMYVVYGHIDEEDSFYVATSTTSVATDLLYAFDPYTGAAYEGFPARYVLSPFPLLYAMLSKITCVSATIITHSVMPVLWIALAYIVYYYIAKELFNNDEQKSVVFMTVISVINIFSAGAQHMQGTMLLIRVWQGGY